MPDPKIAKIKAEAASMAARAKHDHDTAQYAERGGLHEMAVAAELKRQAQGKFAEVKTLEQARKKDLQKIHIARKALAMTEEAYRAMLQRLTGIATTADMNAPQRRQVLAEFRRFGWSAKRKSGSNPQTDKIRALWYELADAGAVSDRSAASLGAYCKRMSGVQPPGWLDGAQESRVIETMKSWLTRVEESAP